MNKLASKWLLLCVVVSALVLTSCGGGGGGSSPNPVTQTPGFSASSSTLNFGNQLANPAGTTTQSVTISNTGNANLTITDVSITGANKDDFQFVNLPARPITVVANSTPLRIDVSFKPGAAGDRVATVSIADNAGGPHTVTLRGRGTLPQVAAIGEVKFSEVVSGSSSSKTVSVRNTGDGDLIISGIAASGGFTYAGNTSMTVSPGNSATLNVSFAPSSSAPVSGSLNITSNASIPPVPLYGLGVAAGRAQSEDASVTLSPDTIAPAPANYPTTIPVTIIGTPGTLFDAGATIANFGPGTTVGDGTTTGLPGDFGLVQVTGDTTTINTTATAQVTFDATVAPGPRFVIVKTGDHLATATFVVPPRDMPVADAGVTQIVDKGKTAHLDGSRSITTSPITVAVSQGGTISASPLLHYQWSLLSAPDGSNAVITDPSGVLCPPEFPAPCSVRPSFDVDKDGNYLVQLAVTDSNGNTTKNWVLVTTPANGYTVPIADAGPDQKVAVGGKVTADGSGSSNPDGEPLTYHWTLVAPANSTAALSSADAVAPTFTADLAGNYKLQLTVKDLHGKAASDTVLVSTTQTPPIAKTGPDQKLNQGDTAQLDGSASQDPDGDNLTCSWYFLALPAASAAQMSNPGPGACATKPAFALDQLGDFVAQLTVADSQGNNSIAATLVSTNDIPPVAVIAGAHHQDATLGDTNPVVLDGSQSHDGAGNALSGCGQQCYTWSMLSRPNGSNATLSNVHSNSPNFPADAGGDYVAQLVVSDGILTSLPSTVRISVGTPVFSIDTNSLGFPNTLVGDTSSSLPITITNTGAGVLEITNVAISGDFGFTAANRPVPVPAGQTATINVTFTPTSGGARTGTLTIAYTAASAGTATVSLSGTATAPIRGITPNPVNFGDQRVNTSATQTVTINNTGNGDLKITSIAIVGAGASDFTVSPSTPQTVHPNSSLNLTVGFTPSITGGRSATLTITDNASGSPATVSLTGNGTAPGIGASPNPVDFGAQFVNTTSAAHTVTITNTGTADLLITGMTFGGDQAGDFAITPALSFPITVHPGAPANTTTFNVTFKPTARSHRRTGSITIANSATNPFVITLLGDGVAPVVSVSPNPAAFGNQLINTPSAPKTVTINNTGDATLSITGIGITGTNSSDFTFQGGTPSTPINIPANGSATVNLIFRPTTKTAETATLVLTDNALDTPQNIPLTGTGTGPGINVDKASLAFGDQLVLQASAAQIVTVTNNGTADLHITALTKSGANPNDYTVTPSAPITLTPNQSTQISVTFTPHATGASSAKLTIANDATNTDVNLGGNGIQPSISVPSLTFPNQPVGILSANTPLVITNNGTAALRVSGLAITAGISDFAVIFTAAFDIPAGGNATINLTFTPTVIGTRNGTLTITSNAPTSPTQVALSGTGTQALIALSPNPVQFGNQLVSTQSNPPKLLTVTNSGNVPLSITGLSIDNTPEFNFGSGFGLPTPASPLTVAANGGTATIPLVFTPSAAGTRSATLSFTDNGTGTQAATLNGTGTQPGQPTFSPSPVTFNQLVGTTSAVVPVTVTNPADASGPLNISAITITGTNAADFATTTTAPINGIAPGASTTINLTFTPGAKGARAAQLTITDNAIGGSHSVNLNGTGTVSSITPPSLTFTGQLLGTTSPVQTITFAYPAGASGTLRLTSATSDNPEFTVTAPAPINLTAPGQSQTIQVTFTPAVAGGTGARSATLTITDNTGSQTVTLSGTPVVPTVSPASLNFPTAQQVGTTSPSSPVTLTNPASSGTLSVTSWSISPTGEFAVVTPPAQSFTVAAGASQQFNITFTPNARGARSADLTITDATGTHTIHLTGTGSGPVYGGFTPNPFDFGSVNVNASSQKTLTISNTGDAPLQITSIAKSGTNAADFSVAPATLTVAANSTNTLTVTFTPTLAAGGPESATLQLSDNASGSPHSIPVSGTAHVVAPNFSPSPSPMTFPDTTAGFSNAMTLVITNNGDANLRITTIVKLGTNASDFTYSVPSGLVGDCSTQNPCDVPAGQSLNVTVTFQPLVVDGAGPKSATLSFADNTPQGIHAVSLSGNSVAPIPILSYSNSTTLPLTFPDTLVGTASGQLAVTITNSGTFDATIPAGGAVITGTNGSEFTINTALPITVPKAVGGVNGSASIVLTFTPTSDQNPRTATLTINPKNGFDNSNLAAQQVTLNGTAHYNGQFNLNSTSVGANLQTLATGSMSRTWSTPLTVTITSSNTNVVLVEPSLSDSQGALQGTGSFSATIPAGHGVLDFGFYAGFFIQAVAPGTATVSITSPGSGFKPATATITVTNSGFVLETPAGTGANFTANLGADRSLTVTARQLDGAGNPLTTSQTLRGGSAVNVNVVSSATNKGTILNNPAVLQPGAQASSAVSFHPVAVGTTQVSINQPAGFTSPASGATATATVTAPTISLNPVTVGFNQQVTGIGNLNQAPTSTLSVTITSNNSGILLSTNAAGVGTTSINLSVAAGTTALPTFYVQGWGAAGTTATLTASATGYSNATANAQVTGSAFVLLSGNQLLGNFSTTTISGPTGLTLGFWQLDAQLRPVSQGIMRPGLSNVQVTITSSNTGTGTVPGTATFNAGDSTNANLSFVPVTSCTTPCTTTLSVNQPSVSYGPPNGGGSVNVTVNKPTVTLRAPTSTIGQNLQVLASGEMDSTSNDILYITLSSNNNNVLFSSSATTQGTTTMQFYVPAGTGLAGSGTFPNYFVQALAGSGTVTINAIVQTWDGSQYHDAGFNVAPVIVTLAPSGFVLDGGNGVGGTIAMSNNTSVNLSVIAVVLDPNTLAPSAVEETVRGGVAASVSVVSGGPAATITGSPVTVSGGTSRNVVTVNAVALSPNPGTAVGIAPTPTGFSQPSSGSQLSVVIN